jgi:archaellum component FlaC
MVIVIFEVPLGGGQGAMIDEPEITLAFIARQLDRIFERLGTVDARLGAMEGRLGAVENRLTGVETRMEAVETRMEAVETRMESMEDKIEILSGVAIRSDGTAQEVGGIRRLLDHLDRRVRKLEVQTPAE